MIEAYKKKTLLVITALIHVSAGDYLYLYPQNVPVQGATIGIPLLVHQQPIVNVVPTVRNYPYPPAEPIVPTASVPFSEPATKSLPYPSVETKNYPYPPPEAIVLSKSSVPALYYESTTSLPYSDAAPIQYDTNFPYPSAEPKYYPYPALEEVKPNTIYKDETNNFPYPAEEPKPTTIFPYPPVENEDLVAPKIADQPKEIVNLPYPAADPPIVTKTTDFPYPQADNKNEDQDFVYPPALPVETKTFPYPAAEPKIVPSLPTDFPYPPPETTAKINSYPYPSVETKVILPSPNISHLEEPSFPYPAKEY